MAYNGDEGKMIDPAIAQKWIDNYQKDLPANGLKSVYAGGKKLQELLKQPNAVGLRAILAKNDNGEITAVIVAVLADERNMAKIDGGKVDGLVLDDTRHCPPYCPPFD